MDWEFVVHHLISGIIPAIAALILYFAILYLIGRKKITDLYDDFVSKKYQNYLETF